MISVEQCFDHAVGEYNKCMGLIEKVGEIINLSDSTSIDVMKEEFDLILQLVLLKIGVADRNLDNVEVEFIEKIVKYGDLVLFWNKNLGGEITWQKIASIDTIVTDRYIELSEQETSNNIYDFLEKIAYADYRNGDMNFLSEFIGEISGIAVDFACLDGECDDDEQAAIKESIYSLVNEHYSIARATLEEA